MQVWTPHVQVSRFGPPKRAGFQVSRFGSPKRAGFQQIVQVSRFGPPPKKKRAGFQVWTPKTCKPARLRGPKPANRVQTWKSARFKGLKPGNVNFGGSRPGNRHVWGVQTWKPARFGGPNLGGPNLETCTFWGVQTWKAARLGGSKPGNLHVLRSKPGNPAYPEIVESSGGGNYFSPPPETMQYRFKDLETSTKPSSLQS